MMNGPVIAALHVVLLAELHPATSRPDRVHAVLAWTDDGSPPIYRPLDVPATATFAPAIPFSVEPASPHVARQLSLDLGEHTRPRASSCGRTWRNWALPTVPARMRHLSPSGVVAELVKRLEA